MQANSVETIDYDLFKKHYSGLSFYAARLIGQDEAEDIVQDVFVELWHNKNKIDFEDNIKSFLYKSVYTKSLNLLKHKSVVESYSAEEQEFYAKKMSYYSHESSDVIARLENKELEKEILDAINELPDKCKEVFKLSYIYEMKNKEISDILGVSVRTVEAHMYKALKILREKLKHLLVIILMFLN